MTLREGQEHFKDGLGGFFQSSEIDFYYKTLLKDGLNRDPIQLSIEPWVELTSEEEFFVKESLSKLIAHQPLQYVLGKAHFRDLTLKVDKRVLIPRPETEEMVEWVLEDFKKLNQKLRLIDMGTGSGCIGIALAKAQPYFSVFALDKDVDILDLTAENAKLNGVQIKCIEQDMNQMNTLKLKIDVIVSNPPYVMLSEQNSLEWGKLGIRVNAISPGFIDAGMSSSHYRDETERKKRESMVPIQRIGTADDIAKVVMFLLSEDSSYIHGENITVDGGVMNSVLANIGRN